MPYASMLCASFCATCLKYFRCLPKNAPHLRIILSYSHPVKGVLTNVLFTFTDTTLVIVSRDCIPSPEDYTLVVTFINTLNLLEQVPHVISLNFSSTVTVVLDMEEELTPDTLYNVSVEIVETTSGIVIDEMNTTIRTPQEPGWL